MRGSYAIRNAANVCGAKNPLALRSTNLRNHFASLGQVLNLKDNELDLLSQYMGHDVRVHREFYHLTNAVLQTSQLAKLFLLTDSGQLPSQKGKSLNEHVATLGQVLNLEDNEKELLAQNMGMM